MITEMPETANPDSAPQGVFLRHLGEGSFRLQHCASCAQPFHFARTICPLCGGTDLSWVEMSGRGTVYSTTTVRRRPERGGDYNICLVDLAEGPRMMARVEGIAPDAVRIGMALRARIVTESDTPIIVFDHENGDRQ